MELASPGWLAVLILLPVLVIARRRRASGVLLPAAAEVARVQRRRDRFLGMLPWVLRLFAIMLVVLALARPRAAGGVVEQDREGVPIVIALDVSSSMLARDLTCESPPCEPSSDQPDRLEIAKTTVGRFIAGRPSDPVGLVAFAGEAITLVPITTHQPLLRAALESVRVGLVEDGTAIGEGLVTAVNRLRRVDAPARVVVLMSDGESNRGVTDPLIAAAVAAELGIRVYTIGVGSEGVAPVPIGGAPEGFAYAERPVAIDEPLLREIARATGGEYHRAADPAALQEVYDRIDRLERAPFEVRTIVTYREWYLWLLAAAAIALALEWAARGSRWGAIP